MILCVTYELLSLHFNIVSRGDDFVLKLLAQLKMCQSIQLFKYNSQKCNYISQEFIYSIRIAFDRFGSWSELNQQ